MFKVKYTNLTPQQLVDKGLALAHSGADLAFSHSIEFFDYALEKDINFAEAYIAKAESFAQMLEVDEARACADKYLEMVPNSLRAYKVLIEVSDLLGEFTTAIKYCNLVLNEEPTNFEIFFKKGSYLRFLDEHNEAMMCYNACLKLQPTNYMALCAKGDCYSEMNKFTEAIKVYANAIAIDGSKSDAYLGTSLCLVKLKNTKSALDYAKKACEVDPDDEWCKCNYALMKYTRC